MKNNTVIHLRLNDELKQQFQEAADKASLSLSDWLRLAGQEMLKKEIVYTKPKVVYTESEPVYTKATPCMTNSPSAFEQFKRKFPKIPHTKY